MTSPGIDIQSLDESFFRFLYFPYTFSNTEQDAYIYLVHIKIFNIKDIKHLRKSTQTEQEERASLVIGLLAIASIPTITGVTFGVSEQRKANTRMQDEKRILHTGILRRRFRKGAEFKWAANCVEG
jgi:hypothetical protein